MNPRNVTRVLAIAGALLLLAGCASGSYPLQMNILEEGEVEHRLAGEMDIGAGAGDVRLAEKNGGLQCDGVVLIGYAVPGCASSGSLRLECSDDRTVTGDWEIEECRRGEGSGQDSLGNTVAFLVGDEALAGHTKKLAPVERITREKPVDAVAFITGGGFAAGFDIASDVIRSKGWDVALSNNESGLVIVQLHELSESDNSLLLAAEQPSPGSEVFVVTATSVISGSLAKDNAIKGTGEVIDGLPVLDIDGRVIGLTRVTNGNLTLFTAERLRRYFTLLDPTLVDAKTEVLPMSAVRERILHFSSADGDNKQ